MLVKLVQPSNAPEPIEVTNLGMVMFERLEQSSNAQEPIVSSRLPSSNVTLTRLVQP